MVRITISTDLQSQLRGLNQPAEVCAEDSRVLGRFIPEGPMLMTVEEARALGLCPFSDEELAEASAEPWEGRPLADILRDLHSAGASWF